MTTYFTSDHHFFHENIIKYCNRPFDNVDQMNNEMLRRWNDAVSIADTVYYLGDMFMGQRELWKPLRDQLHGSIRYIVGNHDRKKILTSLDFEVIAKELVLEFESKDKMHKVLLRHRPEYDLASQYDYHFCGHVHEKWLRKGNIVNASVDVWDFIPRTFEELTQAGHNPIDSIS